MPGSQANDLSFSEDIHHAGAHAPGSIQTKKQTHVETLKSSRSIKQNDSGQLQSDKLEIYDDSGQLQLIQLKTYDETEKLHSTELSTQHYGALKLLQNVQVIKYDAEGGLQNTQFKKYDDLERLQSIHFTQYHSSGVLKSNQIRTYSYHERLGKLKNMHLKNYDNLGELISTQVNTYHYGFSGQLDRIQSRIHHRKAVSQLKKNIRMIPRDNRTDSLFKENIGSFATRNREAYLASRTENDSVLSQNSVLSMPV